MTICRVIHNKNNPFVIVNKTICSDHTISWKAKGLWLYAFSKKDDWQFYEDDLIKASKDSRDSVRAGLKELEKCGYLARFRQRNEKGQLGKSQWLFFETKKSNEEIKKFLPKTDFPAEVFPSQAHYILVSKEETHSPKPSHDEIPEKVESDNRVSEFFSCLKEIEMPLNLKAKLSSEYSEDQVERALQQLFSSNAVIDKPYRWLVKAITEAWEPPANKELIVERNKKAWSDRYQRFDNQTVGGVKISAEKNFVEFFRGGASNCSDAIYWDDFNCIDKIEKKLKGLIASEKENG